MGDRAGFVYVGEAAKARRRWDWTVEGRCSWHQPTTCFTGVDSSAALIRENGHCPTSEPRLSTRLVMPLRDSCHSSVFHLPNTDSSTSVLPTKCSGMSQALLKLTLAS